MGSQWSIRILDGPGGTVVFWPWVPGAKAGDPLYAQVNDLVTWNNTTANTVKLVPVDPKGPVITNPIPSGKVSSPIFSVAAALQYRTADGKAKHCIEIGTQPPATV